MSNVAQSLIPSAATKIGRKRLIKLCQYKIDSINTARKGWAAEAELERERLIAKFRCGWFVRLFMSNTDDDKVFEEGSAGIDGYAITRNYCRLVNRAEVGMVDQLNACLRMKALAEGSAENEIWISDVAFSLLL